ncbi:MAG: aspartate aminotransferase family protein [Chloroflexi bacterium]|nr:aspartate aminotransferase family protein [Chloroflexota bacterium]
MSNRLQELRRAVEHQPPGFDWDARQWREQGSRLLEIVASASTGWDTRRPSPADLDGVLGLFDGLVPSGGASFEELMQRLEHDVLPASAYNGHRRWLAYIMGAPTPISVLGAFAAAALNQNTGLWRVAPSATAIELQTLRWVAEMLGLPQTTEGIFVSGGQMANIVAHAVLRDAKTPWDTRRFGMRGPEGSAPRVRIYASSELHYCHEQAAELLGMGREAVRKVPADDQYRMRVDALVQMIAEDRARGDVPIAIVGTAGTVGTGAIDPLEQLSEVARREDLWLHIDGAYGAFAAMADSSPPELRALAAADSIACDPHKWLFSAIDAGIVLVREPGRLERSFSFHASYLETAASGAQIDLLERSPENSRPLRALKVWLAIQAFGRDGYAAMIDHNIRLAAYLEELVRTTAGLELAAPRRLSIVCWRVHPAGVGAEALDTLQTSVIAELERRGIAMISNVRLRDGHAALRACITNFRTSAEDVEDIVRSSAELGAEIAANGSEAATKASRS